MNKKLKYGGFSLLVTTIFLAGIVLLNVLAGMLTDRFYLKADLTQTKLYSISEKASGVLSAMSEDVEIIVLAEEAAWQSDQRVTIVEVLRNYASVSNGHVKVSYVNPDLNPWLKDKYPEVSSLSTDNIIVASRHRAKSLAVSSLFVWSYNEQSYERYASGIKADQELISAMQYVMNEKVPKAAFLEGHDETAGTQLRTLLTLCGYDCVSINLSSDNIPEDTVFLISIAPTRDFLPQELEKIDGYMAAGGNTMFFYDYETQSLPLFDLFLEEWGVAFEKKMVLDDYYNYYVKNYLRALVKAPEGTPQALGVFEENSVYVGLYRSRPIRSLWTANTKGSRTVYPIVESYPDSSYAKDMMDESLVASAERSDSDEAGPFMLAGAIRQNYYDAQSNYKTCYMIVANAFLVDDTMITNGTYFYNLEMMAALITDLNPFGENVYIESKSFSAQGLDISVGQARFVLVFLVIALPLTIVLIGILVWRRRKHL